MEKIIKGFQQFVNESNGHHSNLSGQTVDFQNFAFLSDEQLSSIDLSAQDQEDSFSEVESAMLDALIEKIGLDTNPDEMDYDLEYFDITVDLENNTYTLHGVYEADAATYSININQPIKVRAKLPMTLPLPKVVTDILSNGYERIDGPGEEDREEYRQLANDWAEAVRQNFKDPHSKFGADKLERFHELGRKLNNPRNRR